MNIVTYSEARQNLKRVLDRVVRDRDISIIARKSGDAVVMSRETWESWQETVYLLRSPANAKRLAESLEQSARDDVRAVDPSTLE